MDLTHPPQCLPLCLLRPSFRLNLLILPFIRPNVFHQTNYMFQPPVLGSWWHRNHHLVSTGIDIDIHFQLSYFLLFVHTSPRIPLSTPSISSLKLITLVCCVSELFIQSLAIYMFPTILFLYFSLFYVSVSYHFLVSPLLRLPLHPLLCARCTCVHKFSLSIPIIYD